MQTAARLETMDAGAVRVQALALPSGIDRIGRDDEWKTHGISQLADERAVLEQMTFAARIEQPDAAQRQLFEEAPDAGPQSRGA